MSIFARFAAASRTRRMKQHLLPLLKSNYRSGSKLKILDIGGTRRFWLPILPLLHGMEFEITVLNVDAKWLGSDDDVFTYVIGNACALEYADNAFDVIVSNSVIEHMEEPDGLVTWSAMQKYASEVQRVGATFYVQAPYFWFPIEPHYQRPFFHWMPIPVQAWFLMRFSLRGAEKADTLHAAYKRLDRSPRLPTYEDMTLLFPSARIEREKVGVLTKSLTAIQQG